MAEVYNNPTNKVFYLDVPVVPISFCTEELKYIDPDSHFIHIPREAYHNFLHLKASHGKSEMPLYVGIRNNSQRVKRLCFGRVEPSIITPNSDHNSMLLPEWALKLLDIDFGGKLDLIYVVQPQSIAYIKVKGNKSSYTKYRDVKAVLESKLSQYNCLNMGEKFTINGEHGEEIGDYQVYGALESSEDSVTFTVVELKDKKGTIIEYGAIFDVEVNIDFEIPEDVERAIEDEKKIKEKEEERKKIPRVLQKARNDQIAETKHIEKSSLSIVNGNIIHNNHVVEHKSHTFGARVHTMKSEEEEGVDEKEEKFIPFEGPGLKMEGNSSRKLTKEEVRALRLRKVTENDGMDIEDKCK